MNQKDVTKISELFKNKYERDLIGKRLGQFHSDFASIDGSESFAIRSIFSGKKIYIDKLSNENELIAYHVRMKGVRNDCIGLTANLLHPGLDPVEFRNGLFYQNGILVNPRLKNSLMICLEENQLSFISV
jgi:hypothetical protein